MFLMWPPSRLLWDNHTTHVLHYGPGTLVAVHPGALSGKENRSLVEADQMDPH